MSADSYKPVGPYVPDWSHLRRGIELGFVEPSGEIRYLPNGMTLAFKPRPARDWRGLRSSAFARPFSDRDCQALAAHLFKATPGRRRA